MSRLSAFNFNKWIEDNKKFLKPPVGNKKVFQDSELMVTVVGGPNKRTDYHHDPFEEFFYQLEGKMILRIMENGSPKDINIQEGEIFLLPPKVPHSPQRFENTVGLVIERKRNITELDGFQWYCDECNELLYEKYFHLTDIVRQLPPLFASFWENKNARTCDVCNAFLEKP